MASHSSIFAWKSPWTEEPSGLQSTGWQSQIRPSTHAKTQKAYVCVYVCIYIYMYKTSSSIHPFMTFSLFPYLGYYKYCCYEHCGACIISN